VNASFSPHIAVINGAFSAHFRFPLKIVRTKRFEPQLERLPRTVQISIMNMHTQAPVLAAMVRPGRLMQLPGVANGQILRSIFRIVIISAVDGHLFTRLFVVLDGHISSGKRYGICTLLPSVDMSF